jgi:hypothetical protein
VQLVAHADLSTHYYMLSFPRGQKTNFAHPTISGNTKFNQLTWVGFTSNATKKTVFYLDNIKLTNEA